MVLFGDDIDVDLEVDDAVSVAPGSDDNEAPVDAVAGDKGLSGSLGKSSAYINLAGLLHKINYRCKLKCLSERKRKHHLFSTP